MVRSTIPHPDPTILTAADQALLIGGKNCCDYRRSLLIMLISLIIRSLLISESVDRDRLSSIENLQTAKKSIRVIRQNQPPNLWVRM
jgi:hypothetical protein